MCVLSISLSNSMVGWPQRASERASEWQREIHTYRNKKRSEKQLDQMAPPCAVGQFYAITCWLTGNVWTCTHISNTTAASTKRRRQRHTWTYTFLYLLSVRSLVQFLFFTFNLVLLLLRWWWWQCRWWWWRSIIIIIVVIMNKIWLYPVLLLLLFLLAFY